MLNQFYKYLSNKLINYFESQNIREGDRFFLELDEDEEVTDFYNVLKEIGTTEEFTYEHIKGSEFETYSLIINEKLKIVVAESVSIEDDYLVTLRNKVSNPIGKWKNSALLVICNDAIDSIYQGMRSLQVEGMPLNVKTISSNLINEINESNLLDVEKEIAKSYLSRKVEDSFRTTLWDYVEIFSIITKESIDKKEYNELGLFPDENLEQYTPNQMKKRLDENFKIYEDIERLHKYGEKTSNLEKEFDSKGISYLTNENWQETDFTIIKKSIENQLLSKKKLKYIENNKKFTNEGLEYWEKPRSTTAVGKRKRHIIVFNNSNQEKVSLKFDFDKNLDRKYFDKKSLDVAECRISQKSLKISFNVDSVITTFKKISYKHNNQPNSSFEFHIAVVNLDTEILNSIKTKYSINNKSKRIVITPDDEDSLTDIKFGKGHDEIEVGIDYEDQIIKLEEEYIISISEDSNWANANLKFKIIANGSSIPMEIKEESYKRLPVNSLRLWKNKREKQEDILFNGKNATQGTAGYNLEEELKNYLFLEQKIIKNEIMFGIRDSDGNIIKQDLKLNKELYDVYKNIYEYYQEKNNIPTLVYLDNELMKIYEKFINIFNREVENINKDIILSNNEEELNLFLLGIIKEEDRILFSSLSPLNIAYQLEVAKQCKNQEIEYNILEKLIPNNLLPYIYNDNDEIYSPTYQKDAHEWIIYKKNKEVSLGTSNAFIANVIKEKIYQFIAHFRYLFNTSNKASLILNIINIDDDREVLKGIFRFMNEKLAKNTKDIIPIRINIYNNKENSSFDDFFKYDTPELVLDNLEIPIKESNKLDSSDILRIIQENISYYKHILSDTVDYEYSHITFYKGDTETKAATDNMDEIETGISLNGLISSETSINNRSEYRKGFGTKNIYNENDILIETAINLNELSLNNKNKGEDSYQKHRTIVTKPMELKEIVLKKLYDTSHWVTFIEPNFGLEYFDNDTNGLVIIHYSEQYSSTTQYDTITVTNRSKQYKKLIKRLLNDKNVDINDKNIETVIKMFNAINGEWLLRIMNSLEKYKNEKLSIISGIKYGLSILDHKEIVWIPVSMEEILRIAGTVKLKKTEGIFSAYNLKKTGEHSDDILFIGVNLENADIYFYPTEVKIGLNRADTIEKGKKQLDKTSKLFKEELGKNSNTPFKNKFFRNFFMQILLTNEQKLVANNLWDEKEMERIHKFKAKLLNDDYEISNSLESFIGKGAIISFKKDNHYRSINIENDLMIIKLTEQDAYNGIAESIQEIFEKIQEGFTDIPKENLISNKDIYSEIYIPEDSKNIYDDFGDDEEESGFGVNDSVDDFDVEDSGDEVESEKTPIMGNLNEVRALIGNVKGSNHKIYWEYGNHGLGNRHLLIQGKSGQGKSYFIQCLLKEISNQKIPSIIIDYTDGFTKSKLEEEFKNSLENKITQYLVIKDKFPISPFRRNKIEIEENEFIDEDNIDIAERFKSVIGSVYNNLGIQQLNSIYQAVISGLVKHEDKMDLSKLEEELLADGSNFAKTAQSQLKILIDKNPFKNDSFDWSILEKYRDHVMIIQLTRYTKDIQKIITEMILWDLWNYKQQNGDKDNPFVVVLDEAQNLDFSDNSPATKILTEGRKFGWSGWFATQSISAQMNKNEIKRLQNAEEKIYFHPSEDDVTYIAGTLTKDNKARKELEQRLLELKKGQCIVHGPMKKDDGELEPPKPTIVDISPLEERN